MHHHHPLLPIPCSFSLPCSPSLTPSTPFLSPPLCHPSIKPPTDGPGPSAQATFCPSFFSLALHMKRRPIKVRLPSSSSPLFSSLHSDSLGSLIKTLYFLFSLLFSPVHPTFLLPFFFIPSLFNLSPLLRSSVFIVTFSGPHLMPLHHSHSFPPFVTSFFTVVLLCPLTSALL